MIIRILCMLLVVAVFLPGYTTAQVSSQSYYTRYDFLTAPPGLYDNGLSGFANPANLGRIKAPELRFHWSTDGTNAGSFQNWGLLYGSRHLSLGAVHQEYGTAKVTDYRLSLGFGSSTSAFGISYGWSTGDDELLGRENVLTLATVDQYNKYLSLGFIGSLSMESSWSELVATLGIRPLGTSVLTVFADGAIEKDMKLKDAPWSAGAIVEPIEGINIVGRYFEDESFTVGLRVSLGTFGIGGQSYYDKRQQLSRYSYFVRTGGLQRSFLTERTQKNTRYLPVSLTGVVGYNKYVLFDDKTLRLMDILTNIRNAVDDPRVSAIAVNLSGMRILPEHAWEIREELRHARKAGLKVIVFIDQVGMSMYHLASVADYIVLDPEGFMNVPGYLQGRTFFKGTIAKLGLGFDEWRFFKYKSAAETFSRSSMSEADALQRQNYIDDIYELAREEICRDRNLSYQQFDDIVNEQVIFLPEEAVAAHLVDTLARWSDKERIIKNVTGEALSRISSDNLLPVSLPAKTWGPKPQVAVVYALGPCAMDNGIRARWLERVFKQLARSRSVKAVVFRVDSPGGDGMASDVVARAVKQCAEKKPVIISQGQVAASGGYWISMYGDTIVAAPNTITGSIGVIGGWVYDKGISNKLGMSSDYVKHGKHADLGFGIRLPYLGLTIPSRNLTTEEYDRMKETILAFYDRFVTKVAAGRGLPVDSIRKIAEGHWYSGTRGKTIGLVDEVGGLMTALAIALEKAGLSPEDEYDIVEIPKSKGLINISKKLSPLSVEIKQDAVYQYLKMTTEHPGKPLPMLLPGTYPTIE